MFNLYDRLSELCKAKGVSGSRMCLDLGVSKSLMSDLKSGRKKSVTAETAKRLADYFGISVDSLLGEKEKPAAESDELGEYLELLKNRPECRMLFQLAKDATKEDVEQAVKIIEALRK